MKWTSKLKKCFRELYQCAFYWLEWRFSDERKNPYRCTVCGSTDVLLKVWSKVNEGGRYSGDCEEFDKSFCNSCDEYIRIRPTSDLLGDAEKWWANTEFQEMEHLTGYRQDDFSSVKGYQDFVDTCNEWWRKLSIEEKIQAWLNS